MELVELGDSIFLQGEVVPVEAFAKHNEELLAGGRRPALAKLVMLGFSALAARLG